MRDSFARSRRALKYEFRRSLKAGEPRRDGIEQTPAAHHAIFVSLKEHCLPGVAFANNNRQSPEFGKLIRNRRGDKFRTPINENNVMGTCGEKTLHKRADFHGYVVGASRRQRSLRGAGKRLIFLKRRDVCGQSADHGR